MAEACSLEVQTFGLEVKIRVAVRDPMPVRGASTVSLNVLTPNG
jgi:hypothetical protein